MLGVKDDCCGPKEWLIGGRNEMLDVSDGWLVHMLGVRNSG